jgi:hypothetical protein
MRIVSDRSPEAIPPSEALSPTRKAYEAAKARSPWPLLDLKAVNFIPQP